MTNALRQCAAEAIAAPEPAFSERRLRGHSGATVTLYSSNSDAFVRKRATHVLASPRLRAQADKQHALWMFGLPFPKIRSQTTGPDGISSFDMNYIPGRTIADAVMNGGAFDPQGVVKAIARLMRLFALGVEGAHPAALFESKIGEIGKNAQKEIADSALIDEIRGCAEILMELDWSGVPNSPSHGDLTLENILLTTGRSIAFIDCDETFASSFWLDFGKLFQDIQGHWCIRGLYHRDARSVDLPNAIQKLDQLGRELRTLAAAMDPALPPRLSQLAALGLFRAIPYAQTPDTARFVCHRIRRLHER